MRLCLASWCLRSGFGSGMQCIQQQVSLSGQVWFLHVHVEGLGSRWSCDDGWADEWGGRSSSMRCCYSDAGSLFFQYEGLGRSVWRWSWKLLCYRRVLLTEGWLVQWCGLVCMRVLQRGWYRCGGCQFVLGEDGYRLGWGVLVWSATRRFCFCYIWQQGQMLHWSFQLSSYDFHR